jgi:multicomponent Na+:H+ antiporter subunit C
MFTYVVALVLVVTGVYALMAKENLIKKIMGLAIFSNGIHLLLISIGYRAYGIAPILQDVNFQQLVTSAVDPLPQALVLTSIVINLSVSAVALSLVIMVYRKFKTLNADRINGLRG